MLKGLGQLEDTLIDATTKRFFHKRRKHYATRIYSKGWWSP